MGVLDPFIIYNEETLEYTNMRGNIINARMVQEVLSIQESLKVNYSVGVMK